MSKWQTLTNTSKMLWTSLFRQIRKLKCFGVATPTYFHPTRRKLIFSPKGSPQPTVIIWRNNSSHSRTTSQRSCLFMVWTQRNLVKIYKGFHLEYQLRSRCSGNAIYQELWCLLILCVVLSALIIGTEGFLSIIESCDAWDVTQSSWDYFLSTADSKWFISWPHFCRADQIVSISGKKFCILQKNSS